MSQIEIIEISKIKKESDLNPRKDFSHVDELAVSMGMRGQDEPILVRPFEGEFQIVDGLCRFKAALKLGWTHIKAQIRQLSDEEAQYLAVKMNLEGERRNLNAIEEGHALLKMKTKYHWDIHKAMRMFHKSEDWIRKRISLAEDLHEDVQNAIMESNDQLLVTPTHGIHLAKLPKEKQVAVLGKIKKGQLSVRETAELVNRLQKGVAIHWMHKASLVDTMEYFAESWENVDLSKRSNEELVKIVRSFINIVHYFRGKSGLRL